MSNLPNVYIDHVRVVHRSKSGDTKSCRVILNGEEFKKPALGKGNLIFGEFFSIEAALNQVELNEENRKTLVKEMEKTEISRKLRFEDLMVLANWAKRARKDVCRELMHFMGIYETPEIIRGSYWILGNRLFCFNSIPGGLMVLDYLVRKGYMDEENGEWSETIRDIREHLKKIHANEEFCFEDIYLIAYEAILTNNIDLI